MLGVSINPFVGPILELFFRISFKARTEQSSVAANKYPNYLPDPSPKLRRDHSLTVLSLLALMKEFSLSRIHNDRTLPV